MAVERFTLQLHDENDADIVAYLNAQDNKNGTMKMALREQMGRSAYLESRENKNDTIRQALRDKMKEA